MASMSAACEPLLEQMVQGILDNSYLLYEMAENYRNIQVDDIVCLRDEPTSPTKWPLAYVIAVYPGLDRMVRVVKLRNFQRHL